jgi:hypothetical protein
MNVRKPKIIVKIPVTDDTIIICLFISAALFMLELIKPMYMYKPRTPRPNKPKNRFAYIDSMPTVTSN